MDAYRPVRPVILALLLPMAISLTAPAASAKDTGSKGSETKGSLSAPAARSSVRSILPMQIRLPEQVRIFADGRVRTINTMAITVSDVVKEAKISMGPHDLINAPLPTHIFSGLQIRITRITEVRSVKQIKIPYIVRRILSRKVLVGKRILKSRGVSGMAEVRSIKILADGKIVKTTIVSKLTIKPAHDARIIVGTRPRTVNDLNWAAVAQCESRGNPRSSNSANGYYGMFQFSVTAWKTAGGSGNPMDYSAAEQLMRAKRLYQIRGWRAWPVCGKLL